MPKHNIGPRIDPVSGLTGVEHEMLEALSHGESIESIAGLLSITPDAALEARNALMEQLSATSTADLVRIGLVARARWTGAKWGQAPQHEEAIGPR